MKTLDISGSVEQKLAALAFTEKLKNYFKLYPHTIARDIREGARKAKISPLEMVEAFEKSLPQMMMDCLAETKAILQKPGPAKKDASAKLTPVHEPEINTLIRINRALKPAYPDWVKEVIHPELEGVGPAEYDMTKVELRLHDDQKDGGYTTGHKIYEHLKATDSLKNCFGLDDALAIQKNGIAAFRKVFGNKVVVCWRSVVGDQSGYLNVPYVYDRGGKVVVDWNWLGSYFDGYDPAGCFAQ